MTPSLYVETSALLSVLLERDKSITRTLRTARKHVTSALTYLEADRAIRRALREGRIASISGPLANLRAFERAADTLTISDEILQGARREFPKEPVRSLDAIHLASLVFWSNEVGPVELLSTDLRVRTNAEHLGFRVLPNQASPGEGRGRRVKREWAYEERLGRPRPR